MKIYPFLIQDTVIYERLSPDNLNKDLTLQHLEEFATEGIFFSCLSEGLTLDILQTER